MNILISIKDRLIIMSKEGNSNLRRHETLNEFDVSKMRIGDLW